VRVNGVLYEGFKTRPNYKRKLGGHSVYKWRNYAAGRTALILIGLIAEQKAGPSVEIRRDWKQQGVTGKFLFQSLTNIFPEFADIYLAGRGVPLTPKIVYNRLHKMFYENEAPRAERGRRSPEHYMVSSCLRLRVGAVSELFHRGTIITRVEAEKAGGK